MSHKLQYEEEAREKKIGLWATVEKPELKADSKSEDTIVYITRFGKKYHREGCSSLKKSKVPMTLKEASKRGYTPCALCDPPKIKKKEPRLPYRASIGAVRYIRLLGSASSDYVITLFFEPHLATRM